SVKDLDLAEAEDVVAVRAVDPDRQHRAADAVVRDARDDARRAGQELLARASARTIADDRHREPGHQPQPVEDTAIRRAAPDRRSGRTSKVLPVKTHSHYSQK